MRLLCQVLANELSIIMMSGDRLITHIFQWL